MSENLEQHLLRILREVPGARGGHRTDSTQTLWSGCASRDRYRLEDGVAPLVEHAWRSLHAPAWADFYRFLQGWSPGGWKIHGYSERLAGPPSGASIRWTAPCPLPRGSPVSQSPSPWWRGMARR